MCFLLHQSGGLQNSGPFACPPLLTCVGESACMGEPVSEPDAAPLHRTFLLSFSPNHFNQSEKRAPIELVLCRRRRRRRLFAERNRFAKPPRHLPPSPPLSSVLPSFFPSSTMSKTCVCLRTPLARLLRLTCSHYRAVRSYLLQWFLSLLNW